MELPLRRDGCELTKLEIFIFNFAYLVELSSTERATQRLAEGRSSAPENGLSIAATNPDNPHACRGLCVDGASSVPLSLLTSVTGYSKYAAATDPQKLGLLATSGMGADPL